jgi:hypothetical protein
MSNKNTPAELEIHGGVKQALWIMFGIPTFIPSEISDCKKGKTVPVTGRGGP